MEAGDKLKNGETVNVVELYKMSDESYAGQQVYDINVSYMKFWIDEYYSLPYDVVSEGKDGEKKDLWYLE